MDKWITPVNSSLALFIIMALAMITADLFSSRLAKTFPVSSTARTSSAVATTNVEGLASFAPILELGLFGPATRGKLTPIVAAQQQGTTSTVNQGDLLLLGTAVGSFRETFALIQKTSTKEERVFRLGDTVFTGGRLVAVHKDFADIVVAGRPIRIFSPTAPMGAAGASPPSTIPPSQTGLATQVSSGSYIIDQRALNAALDNIGQAMTDARLLPSSKEGKVEGFKVSEVRPSGIFAMIGIKNGDVLLRLNDFAIDSPEKAIQSLASLKGQTRIKLDLIRDGQPATFSYDIR
ncbi:MAG: PDZ domain-containing protein [Geobacter sp.]|nr:PDZ domain-containing protein [Geobacter sp.]